MNFDQLLQTLSQTNYNEADKSQIFDQLQFFNLEYVYDLQFECKNINGKKLLQITGFMIHSSKDPVQFQLLIYAPIQQGIIQVLIVNHQPQKQIFSDPFNLGEQTKFSMQKMNTNIQKEIQELKNYIEQLYPFQPRPGYVEESPVQKQLNQSIQKIINEMQNDWQELKSLEVAFQKEYKESQQKRSQLKQLNYDLEKKIQTLFQEVQVLRQFRSDNNECFVDENNILKILSLQLDEEQILEINAEINGAKQAYRYIVYNFQHQHVPFDNILSITRKIAEQEFWDKLLLKKCLVRSGK